MPQTKHTNEAVLARFREIRPKYTSDAAAIEALRLECGYNRARTVREKLLKAGWIPQPQFASRILELETEIQDLKAQLYSDAQDADTLFDDTPQLEALLTKLAVEKDYGCFLAWYDLHFPDHNAQAINLGVQLEKIIKPDFNLFGGDVFSFDTLGSYTVSRKRPRHDPFLEVERDWKGLHDRLDQRSIVIGGNHDGAKAGRVQRALDETYQLFADRIEGGFVEMVRCGGRALYLNGMNEVHFNSAYAHHGVRTGENAFKTALKDLGWGRTTIQGHTHQPGLYVMKQYMPGQDPQGYRVVMSAVTGMLGNLKPDYQAATTPTKWLHSMAVVHFSFRTWVANVQLIVFHRAPNGDLVAFYGNDIVVEAATGLRAVPKAHPLAAVGENARAA